jgi:hypothetical protein
MKRTSYNLILVLAVVSLLFFAPKGVFATTLVSGTGSDTLVMTHIANSTASVDRVLQPLGTGFSNTGGTVILYFKGSSAVITESGSGLALYSWSSQSAFVSGGGNLSTGTLVETILSGYTAGSSTDFTISHSYTSALNPSLFYALYFIGADTSTNVGLTIYGSTSTPVSGLPRAFNQLCQFGGGYGSCPHNYPLQQISFAFTDSGGFTPPPPTTTNITAISPQLTDPFTQTATTSVSYTITAADLAAGTTTLSYVITSQDSIGNAVPQIGSIIATSSGSFTNTFYMGTTQAAWSAFYTLTGTAGTDPNIGAFFSVSTSTFWVNGTSTYLNITTSTSTGSTTNGASLQQCKSTSLIDFDFFACEIGNRFSDVFQWLFQPKAGSLDQYQPMVTTLQTKMPFGYFFLIKNAIIGVNASSTSTFTLTLDQGVLSGIITPLRTALAWVLLMGFGFWFYMRMKHLDIG